jgi:hypothetical protein
LYSFASVTVVDKPAWVVPADDGPDWVWTAPDLSSGGDWHTAHIANLWSAIHGLPNAEEQLIEGLQALDIHRQNYAKEGSIHRLQLLWWNFPPEHSEELRNGCTMNFLMELTAGIKNNSPMTDKQVEIAAEFIDELWQIGVFELILDDCVMKANAPLFAVAIVGQPGRWRIIANMKAAVKTSTLGKIQPIYLMHMYSGATVQGWLVSYCGC